MKIYQITQLNESPQKAARLADKILTKMDSFNTDSGNGPQNGRQGQRGVSVASRIEEVISKIKSGEAKLSKDIDAELGKRGADFGRIHSSIIEKIQTAGRELAMEIIEEKKLKGSRANSLISRVQHNFHIAAFGYINKKYLNGDADVFNGDTGGMVYRALQSQAPKGGQQPIGRVSSSRPNGQQGTVGSGQGTNALDAMAANSQDW